MKTKRNKNQVEFLGYSDAPPDLEKAMANARPIKDFLPSPENLFPKIVSEKEKKLTKHAWKRYRIKEGERGHRTPLSKTLKEPTARLDTSILLPRRVYNWIQTKPNKAAFIREIMIKSFKKNNVQ